MITRELIIQLQEITAPDRVREKEILASHASFRTGGPADLFIQVSDREELQKVMDLLAQAQTHVEEIAAKENIPVIARIPIDPEMTGFFDTGKAEYYESTFMEGLKDILPPIE